MTQEEKKIFEKKTTQSTKVIEMISWAITAGIMWLLIKFGIFKLDNLGVCEMFMGAFILSLLWEGYKLYRLNKKHPDETE